jgi:hypothetical protein
VSDAVPEGGPACHWCSIAPPPVCKRATCQRSRLARRLEKVLDDGTGTINPALQPLARLLFDAPNPESTRCWLNKPVPVSLLRELATGAIAVTHDALSTHPHHVAAAYLRSLLISCGIIEPVDKHLVDFEAWLHRRLRGLSEHPHERLLRQFGRWHQLPRLRSTAAQRPLRATALLYACRQFNAAEVFLDWTVHNGLTLHGLTQANIDSWSTTHASHHRLSAHGFLTWAMDHRHMPRHVMTRPQFKAGGAITQQRRLDLIRRYVGDDAAPLSSRIAICIMLLYAQPLSRVLRLTAADIATDQQHQVSIAFGYPSTPVPEPFAELLLHLVANRDYPSSASTTSRWLFPGRVADQPLAYTTMLKRLRRLGFPMREARVSALRQLVLQAPAPVVAAALGFHHTTTTRQVANVGATWSSYTAGRSRQR